MRGIIIRKRVAVLSLLSLLVALLTAFGGAAATTVAATSTVKTTSLGTFAPTFVGPAATGCAKGCSLLSGPVSATATAAAPAATGTGAGTASRPHAMASPNAHPLHLSAAAKRALAQVASFPVPSVSCVPLGPGCDSISTSAGGATGVKGLKAVDSAKHTANEFKDVEPPDQGLCAGNGSVVETNNIGEILVFNTALHRTSSPISLDTIMGLTGLNWSSGGDPSCLYDFANGGHWFFTEIVSASPEATGGAFTGCFSAVANECYEGIAVSNNADPLGGYHVYFSSADYNPAEPGSPTLLNDFAKISVTRDAFLMFYDEFPLSGASPGFGGGFFNGAQEFAFNKSALEQGLPVWLSPGKPNPKVTVARENMGLIATPDGTCARDKVLHQGGITCWVAVIPAQPADAGQFDNSNGGSGFMLGSLDFYGFVPLPTSGDNRIAAWAWTGLSALNSSGCSACGAIHFSGELFTGVDRYYGPENLASPQKAGPIPLGDECGAAGLSVGSPPPASCPEGGIATNGDFMTQVSQSQGQLFGATNTLLAQTYKGANAEFHQSAVYWVLGTSSFDSTGKFTLTNQGYVSAAHEDLEMPAIAAEGTGGNGKAIMFFTVNGNGGPTGADNGGFYPSTAFGRLTSTSNGLLNSTINIADMGKSPQDGFSEYQGYPGTTRPRWGDYSWGIFLPGSGGRIYFANEYIQYPNCTGSAFTLTIGTCGGTRDGLANWGTSVNYVVP